MSDQDHETTDPVIEDDEPEATEVPELPDDGAGPEVSEAAPEPAAPAAYAPLRFVDVVMVLPSTHPVLILAEEAAPHRELHIPIGVAEGTAIAYAARGVETPRPLTHELFAETLAAFGLTIETVRITSVTNTSYTAEVIMTGSLGIRVLACRVSDGVCLALRQRLEVPITAAAAVLDQAGFDAGAA